MFLIKLTDDMEVIVWYTVKMVVTDPQQSGWVQASHVHFNTNTCQIMPPGKRMQATVVFCS